MTRHGQGPAATAAIERDPAGAARGEHDLIVVGGGIHGACLALEAARRGLRPLLVERRDFGGATSANSLRIVHGGLRYLQRLDLRRFRQSVRERRWFLRHFPDLVRPLACMMPLYGEGLRRPAVFRVALALNDLISSGRDRGVVADRMIPRSRLIGRDETLGRFPGADPDGLRGAATWHDGVMLSSERLQIEILRWACARGATALNYVEVEEPLLGDGRIRGVRARDVETGGSLELVAPVVVNCAGPWCRSLGARFDRDVPELFRRSLAFNLLLDREPPFAAGAVAVTPRVADARTYFLMAWKGRTFAGTFHMPWDEPERDVPRPPEEAVGRFLEHLAAAIPGWSAGPERVLRIYAGQLPADAPASGEPARHPVLYDHGRHGGPAGCYTVSGVKYTTAREVAERCLRMVYGNRLRDVDEEARPDGTGREDLADAAGLVRDERGFGEQVRALVRDEAALHLDDLLLRRMDGLYTPEELDRAARIAANALDWSGARLEDERSRLGAGVTPTSAAASPGTP